MPPVTLHETTPELLSAFVDSHDHFLFDLDGCIWTGPGGNILTPNVANTLAHLRALNKRIAFCTNNATQSRATYLAKLLELGVHATADEIFTCGSATASYLREVVLPTCAPERRGIYVIGQEGLEEELLDEGLSWRGGTHAEDDVLLPPQDFSSIRVDPSIGIVVFSFQMRINYKQLAQGYNYLATNPGCQLILTNDDPTVLLDDGSLVPGEGALVAPLLHALKPGVKPVIVGKPNKPLLDVVHAKLGFDPQRTVFIGDRLETDVLFGKLGGLTTLLVLTGASKLQDLHGLADTHAPDFVASHVGILAPTVPAVPVVA